MAAAALLEAPELATRTAVEPPDDALYEVVDGRRVETPSMSSHASRMATQLIGDLVIYLRQQAPPPGHLAIERPFGPRGDVLPGFRTSLDRLFDPIATANGKHS